ncbi:hypothetical protein BH18THE2_BH18THE2_30810 [soil metagenome]
MIMNETLGRDGGSKVIIENYLTVIITDSPLPPTILNTRLEHI